MTNNYLKNSENHADNYYQSSKNFQKKKRQNCLENTKNCKSPSSDYFSNLNKECFQIEKEKLKEKKQSRSKHQQYKENEDPNKKNSGESYQKEITGTFCNEKVKHVHKKKAISKVTIVADKDIPITHYHTKSPDNIKRINSEYTDKKIDTSTRKKIIANS